MSNTDETSKKIEELQAQAEKVKEHAPDAKEVMDRLFNEDLDNDEAWKLMAEAGQYMMEAVALRDKLTGAKILNVKGLVKAKKLADILRESRPDAEVIFDKDEISNRFFVECFREKGVGFSDDVWQAIYPLVDECDVVSALIDDFDETKAGICFGFSPLYFTAPKTPDQL